MVKVMVVKVIVEEVKVVELLVGHGGRGGIITTSGFVEQRVDIHFAQRM